MKRLAWAAAAATGISLSLLPIPACAHKDDYIDETLVFLTLEGGEIEPEYWLDYGRDAAEAQSFFRHNVSLEYGLTDHWMVETRVTGRHDLGDGFSFDSARLETRYRFHDEGELPVDIAISGEVNTENHEGHGQELGLEPRLILSRDLGELNLTLNLADEIVPRAREASFNTSFGVRYNLGDWFRVGSECKYDFRSREGSVIPQVWFVFREEVALKLGFSVGFDQSRENFARIALELSF